jgi:hypothetical protein
MEQWGGTAVHITALHLIVSVHASSELMGPPVLLRHLRADEH